MSCPVGFLDLELSPFPRSLGWGKVWGPGRREAWEERMESQTHLHHEVPISLEAGLVEN